MIYHQKKKSNGFGCTSDIGDIKYDTRAPPIARRLNKVGESISLYEFDNNNNCIVNPILNASYCNDDDDGNVYQFNPSTNTCQRDARCETTYIPDSMLEAQKKLRQKQ